MTGTLPTYTTLRSRRKESSESFTQGKNYFISEIHASGDRYAFFSVPYDECWRATVNGESREVININGLMAVRIDAGDNILKNGCHHHFKAVFSVPVCSEWERPENRLSLQHL